MRREKTNLTVLQSEIDMKLERQLASSYSSIRATGKRLNRRPRMSQVKNEEFRGIAIRIRNFIPPNVRTKLP